MSSSWTPAEREAFDARRRSRNIALGLVLGALVALFFGITIVKLAPPDVQVVAPVVAPVAAPVMAPDAIGKTTADLAPMAGKGEAQ